MGILIGIILLFIAGWVLLVALNLGFMWLFKKLDIDY